VAPGHLREFGNQREYGVYEDGEMTFWSEPALAATHA